MAPWDELTYFDLPLVTVTHIPPSNVGIQILGANPLRVVSVIGFLGSTGAKTAFIRPTTGQIDGSGLQISNANLPVVFTAKDHPSLCQAAWFAVSPAAAVDIETFEVCMHDWPRTEGTELAMVLAALKAILKLRS